MKYFFRALRAEILKTKRTLALWMIVLAPLALAFMGFAVFAHNLQYATEPVSEAWISISQNILILWTLLMLPLFVTLETGLLNNLEHGQKNWKLLYTLPIPRWAIYTAKLIVSLGVIGISMLVLVGFIFIDGKLLMLIYPGVGFEAPVPIWTILKYTGLTYLSSWLIIAIHHWVSSHWSSFVFAMGFGIVATIATVLVIESEDFGPYYPWTLPSVVEQGLVNGGIALTPLLIGLIGGLVVSIIGCWEVTRRDVL